MLSGLYLNKKIKLGNTEAPRYFFKKIAKRKRKRKPKNYLDLIQ